MPPKKAAKKPVAAKNYKLPDPLPSGLILTDILKNQWRLGKSIGQGGFGEIYTASNIVQKAQSEKSDYVIKIEPHSNGPLFVEMHCYMKIAKPDSIESWKKTKKLKHLGMPKYFGSGSHEYKGQKYRFMVMQRFGQDLQKIINKHEKMFSYKTVFQVVIQILDVLEYIHSHGYIHADIKASNLLVGYQKGTESDVYLVDYGLACRYAQPDGRHKEYKYDQRKAHDGTIEFTSRDAHIGAHSRRGDLEILGYNLVQWLCGKLPWEDNLQDCDYVANKKRLLMDDIPRFMKLCFPDGVPPGIPDFMKYVASLTFDEKPSYEKCKAILREGLKKRGHTDDGKLVFLSATPKTNPRLFNGKKKSRKRRSEDEENIGQTPFKKRMSPAGREPCKPRNFNNRALARIRNEMKESDISLNTPPKGDLLMDIEAKIIMEENLKMIERQKQQRPKTKAPKPRPPPDPYASLANPTPQMLEVMAKRREKSVSPPICTKQHRHNSHCQLGFRAPPITKGSGDHDGTILTPAMEEVIKRRNDRLNGGADERGWIGNESSQRSSNRGHTRSPDIFDSDEEDITSDEDDISAEQSCYSESSNYSDTDAESEPLDISEISFSDQNSTVFYSPCGSLSPSSDCQNGRHVNGAAKLPVRTYSARRSSSSGRRNTSLSSSSSDSDVSLKGCRRFGRPPGRRLKVARPIIRDTRSNTIRPTRKAAQRLSPEI